MNGEEKGKATRCEGDRRSRAARVEPDLGAVRVDLRPARQDEVGAVRRLLAQADLPVQGLEEVELVVATCEDAVLSAIGVERRGEDALFRSLVLDPPWRGRELGKRLHDALAQRAKASGVRRAYLLTTTIAARRVLGLPDHRSHAVARRRSADVGGRVGLLRLRSGDGPGTMKSSTRRSLAHA